MRKKDGQHVEGQHHAIQALAPFLGAHNLAAARAPGSHLFCSSMHQHRSQRLLYHPLAS